MRKTQQQLPAVLPKKNLLPNPITRQPSGTSPPVRPYDDKSLSDRGLQVLQDSMVSLSPQPFRLNAEDSRRDTFVVAHKEVFENASMTSSASPRRDTFVVPKSSTMIHEETTIIRRETFVTSASKAMITSTPRSDLATKMNDDDDKERRHDYILPSTVKKHVEPEVFEKKMTNEVGSKKAMTFLDVQYINDQPKKDAIGELYESFVHKRALVKCQSQSE